MSQETGKACLRRQHDIRYVRWLAGNGIDIGSGDDPLTRYVGLFPLTKSVRVFDKAHGDAMTMIGVELNSYDFVHSSHCLEHLAHPELALTRWVRLCKPGGHLVITVPDEDMYEHGQWPSQFNAEHKWSFNTGKPARDDRPQSISLFDLLPKLHYHTRIESVQRLSGGYDPGLPSSYDQSLLIPCEPAIEFVLRKR